MEELSEPIFPTLCLQHADAIELILVFLPSCLGDRFQKSALLVVFHVNFSPVPAVDDREVSDPIPNFNCSNGRHRDLLLADVLIGEKE